MLDISRNRQTQNMKHSTAFPLQQWLRERASMLRLYVRCLYRYILLHIHSTYYYRRKLIQRLQHKNDQLLLSVLRNTWQASAEPRGSGEASLRNTKVGYVGLSYFSELARHTRGDTGQHKRKSL
jgi:hypothetical protein